MAPWGPSVYSAAHQIPRLHQKAHGKLTGEAGGLRRMRVCNLEPTKLVESGLSGFGRRSA